MTILRNALAIALLALAAYSSVANPAAAPSEPLCGHPGAAAPDWILNRTIYEVNVRQFSQEGTFAAVEEQLDRIQNLGIGVIWLIPIHPIGAINRKGPLGSYYSVADYKGINPEFGDADSFRSLVDAAHARDIKVIIDWVGNHTAWDNPLVTEHPEFFAKDENGNFTPPHGTDWTDVIQLDFQNRDLWEYMTEALEYWVSEYNIDGYRCDYAVGLPTEFWEFAATRLKERKPDIFLLAESDAQALNLNAFHSSYAWSMHHVFNDVAQGKSLPASIQEQFNRQSILFPQDTLLLNFTSNHDENSWAGTTAERLGPAKRSFEVLVFTLPGIPLIYNGQEAGLAKRLKFFDRDPIDWSELSESTFYQALTKLKRENPVLGHLESSFKRISTTADKQVFAFARTYQQSQIVVINNLSNEEAVFYAADEDFTGEYRDYFSGAKRSIESPLAFTLAPWNFVVLVRE